MTSRSEALRTQLREAGLTAEAIEAIWPTWWSDEAEGSLSADAELRYTVARRLGLSPRSLFEDSPRFVWHDETKYKNLGTHSERELSILSSFGVAVARHAIEASPPPRELADAPSAAALRAAILRGSSFVRLDDLLAFSWGYGIPVLQVNLFPLSAKRMHAMTVRAGDRYALLIARRSKFASQVAYIIAHELGHVLMHHISDATALLEAEDPLQVQNPDDEEQAADIFALELLTGRADPQVETDRQEFSASELAHAALEAADRVAVDPGILALCLGHVTGKWKEAFGALKILPPGEMDVGGFINSVARSQFRWEAISFDTREFLNAIMGDDAGGAPG